MSGTPVVRGLADGDLIAINAIVVEAPLWRTKQHYTRLLMNVPILLGGCINDGFEV